MGKRAPIRPSWTASLGTLIDAGVEVRALCSTCRRSRDVDLASLAALRGRDFDLWNRRPPCRLTPECRGRILFLHSGRGPMQAMRDS